MGLPDNSLLFQVWTGNAVSIHHSDTMRRFCGTALLAAAAVAVSGSEVGLMLGDAASAGCQVTEDLGCFKDTAAARLLP